MLAKSVTPKTTLQHSKEPEYFSPSVQPAGGALLSKLKQIHNFVIQYAL
jgi:hypothetical protein